MKKLIALSFFIALLASSVSFAAAEVPAAAVWFEPATAAVDAPITLHALVYNNQAVDATVVVSFSTPAGKIGEVSDTIAKQTAKTVSIAWKMPAKGTVVTAAVTKATDKNKKALAPLVGTIGTVTVATAPTPLIGGKTIPGLKQVKAWFGPLLDSIEKFREGETVKFEHLRDTKRVALGIGVENPAPDKDAASNALGNPGDYFLYLYGTAMASVFSSVALFYIASVLIILFLLRFIVNLLF